VDEEGSEEKKSDRMERMKKHFGTARAYAAGKARHLRDKAKHWRKSKKGSLADDSEQLVDEAAGDEADLGGDDDAGALAQEGMDEEGSEEKKGKGKGKGKRLPSGVSKKMKKAFADRSQNVVELEVNGKSGEGVELDLAA